MIGDRLDTECVQPLSADLSSEHLHCNSIAFGINGGIKTLMVLTGISAREHFEKPGAPTVPQYLANSLGDFA